MPLLVVTQEGDSPYVKKKAYHLLTELLALKPKPEASELDKRAMSSINANVIEMLTSIEKSLQDQEMRKAKNAREILKVLVKILPYADASTSPEVAERLDCIKKLVEELTSSESIGVQSDCTKALRLIDERVSSIKQPTADIETTADIEEETPSKTPMSETRKKKKKNKKKKKGKK